MMLRQTILNEQAVVQEWIRLHLASLAMGLISAGLILFVGLFVARAVSSVIHSAMLRTPMRDRILLVNFLTRTARVVVTVFVGVIALSQLGIDIAPLIAGIGIGGFIVGFAFKDSLSNLAAGLLLLFYQPFEIGDFVEAGGQTGSVLDMSVAATELKLPDGRLAIVPNARIWNAPIINFNRLGVRRLEWTVGVGAGADLDVALRTLRAAVAADERVLDDPVPEFAVNGVGAASVELVIRAWVPPADVSDAASDLRRAFKQALERAEVPRA